MRKKALLIGARSSFRGPWVTLEEGEWIIEANPPLDHLTIFIDLNGEGTLEATLEELAGVTGPCRVLAQMPELYDGPDLHVNARQTS